MAFITNEANTELFSHLNKKTQAKAESLAENLAEVITERKEIVADEEAAKTAFKPVAKQAYFEQNETEAVPAHTFDVGDLQVNFVNAYVIKDEDHASEIIELLGEDHPLVDEIVATTTVSIDVTELDKQDFIAFAKELKELKDAYGVKTVVDTKWSVTPEFHDKRHDLLTAEDNLSLDEVLPVQVQINVVE